MGIIAQFAKAVCNRKISLQEIEQSGYRNPDTVFGVLTNEIFGQNNLNDRLYLYVNLKQNRNGFKDSLVNKIVHDKGCNILAAERVSASDGNEPLVTHIVSALITENNDESPIQEVETRSDDSIAPFNLNCIAQLKSMDKNLKENVSDDFSQTTHNLKIFPSILLNHQI